MYVTLANAQCYNDTYWLDRITTYRVLNDNPAVYVRTK